MCSPAAFAVLRTWPAEDTRHKQLLRIASPPACFGRTHLCTLAFRVSLPRVRVPVVTTQQWIRAALAKQAICRQFFCLAFWALLACKGDSAYSGNNPKTVTLHYLGALTFAAFTSARTHVRSKKAKHGSSSWCVKRHAFSQKSCKEMTWVRLA